jgi:hypothetical protein
VNARSSKGKAPAPTKLQVIGVVTAPPGEQVDLPGGRVLEIKAWLIVKDAGSDDVKSIALVRHPSPSDGSLVTIADHWHEMTRGGAS